MKRVWEVAWVGLFAIVILGMAGVAIAQITTLPEGYTNAQGRLLWQPSMPKGEGTVMKIRAPAVAPEGNIAYAWIAYPTGVKATSVLLVEKFSPRTALAGRPYHYAVKVTNLTELLLHNVKVSERIPESFTISRSAPEFVRAADGTAQWDLGVLNPRESRFIELEGTAGDAGSIPCCTAATYEMPGLCLTTNIVQPALSLTMSAPPQTLICDSIPLSLTVRNTGDGAAGDVRIAAVLPEGLTTMEGRSGETFAIGMLQAGESRSFTFQTKAYAPGVYTHKASVTGEGGLSATAMGGTTTVREPRLTVATTGSKEEFTGHTFAYKSTITNTGDAEARAFTVEQTIPEGARLLNASAGGRMAGGRVSWALNTLAPGESAQVDMTLQATVPRVLKTDVSATAACCKTAMASAETLVRATSAVLVEVVDQNDPIELGGTAILIIRVTNQGSATQTGVRVDAKLDPGMEFVSATGKTAGSLRNGLVTFAPLRTLPAGDTAEWRMIVKGNADGDLRTHVSVVSDEIVKAVEEGESTHVY
jgi:uncharacterized repeat protein (TIGR01451 family)